MSTRLDEHTSCVLKHLHSARVGQDAGVSQLAKDRHHSRVKQATTCRAMHLLLVAAAADSRSLWVLCLPNVLEVAHGEHKVGLREHAWPQAAGREDHVS